MTAAHTCDRCDRTFPNPQGLGSHRRFCSSEPEQPPRRISGWQILATCPACGDELTHLADGRPNISTARAIAQCSACERQWAVEVTIADVTAVVGGRPAHRADCTCRPCRIRRGEEAA